MATNLGDYEFINKISSFTRISYHANCKKIFGNMVRSVQLSEFEKNEWHQVREENKHAFHVVASFVEEHVIKLHECFLLKFLESMFVDEVIKINPQMIEEMLGTRYLEKRLENYFLKKYLFEFLKTQKLFCPLVLLFRF